ncbi:phosphoglucomutase/phosphomannomutase subunit alpha/beta [Moraxella macacae 0408225]|uniref:phosphomannomutase n=1 Tax=Moraxella macacae 0408225 TaxID=1230338 RepID=L2F742_9GAMM|nr:phosphoglucomutase/phosphomannomutase subunit alpha/beta [Moraxella macacae]ELA08904.1 phosphoglucomutase/phosphomannomutase subunit alpha/beta [Moraxella macacae 0408225]
MTTTYQNTTDTHPFLPQQKLFKAYDIRGETHLFCDDFLWALANVFAKRYRLVTDSVVIGYDVRQHSETIAKFLAAACYQQGLSVHWLGQVTTPIMAFLANQATGNGLMVTASHSKKDIHGIKWLINRESPSSQDIQDLFVQLGTIPKTIFSPKLLSKINNIYQKINHIDNGFTQYQQGITQAFANIYQQNYVEIFNNKPKPTIVIDCMNGATANFAKQLFGKFGYHCIMLNATPNPNFPKGNPDPCEAGRLDELSQAVCTHKADMGLAFDGDGDRLMIVSSKGNMVSPDHLLYLLAKIAIDERPQKSNITQHQPLEIIFDVKCSHHLPRLIANQGAVPIMEKTGSSLMRKSLQNQSRKSLFAGELSGHFLFNDGYFLLHDDAIYAGLRLLNWLTFQPNNLTQILENLPKSISTADMYLPLHNAEHGQKLLKNLLNLSKKPFFFLKQRFHIKNIATIDGLRLDFGFGFGILRQSNTGNFLTVRFCADSMAELQQVQRVFVGLCQVIDDDPQHTIAKQIANIQPILA